MGASGGRPRCVLAVDHGTSGCKTALVSLDDGAVLDFAFQPTTLHHLPDGGVEQDPEDWWAALLDTARRVLAGGRVAPEDVVAVCCSSTFSTTVAVAEDGAPVAPALTWMDARGAPHVRRLVRGLVNVAGYGVGNLLRWVPPTGGGPTLSGKDDAAHVLFWKHERPDVYRAARWFLPSKDWLNLRLTGRAVATVDSVTLFWATDNRDLARVRWHDGLLARMGIDRGKLPDLIHATDVVGPILPAVADAIGLPRGVPVVAGAADLQSACVGSGAVRDFEGHLYVGTSSWVLCHVPFKRTDAFHAIASLPSAIPGRWFCANEQDSAGACLDFLVNTVLFPRDALRPEPPPADVHARLDALAATAPPGSGGVLFTPWLNGEKSPADDATVRGGFHNLSLSTTSAALVRAVYEGVALNTRWLLGHVERFVRRPLEPLNFIGGGARSPVWCQIFADVLGRTIRQVADPLQANARGAAFVAGVALGHLTFEDVPARTRIERTFTPDPANRLVYEAQAEAFVALYRRNRALYRRLNARRLNARRLNARRLNARR